jgi:hypothetical protein
MSETTRRLIGDKYVATPLPAHARPGASAEFVARYVVGPKKPVSMRNDLSARRMQEQERQSSTQ